MFGVLTDKLQDAFKGIMGKKKLTEENISDAVREVRLALLEADVNYGVAKKFIKGVKEKALGDEVLKSVQAGQQFVKLIHDELAALMGEGEASIALDAKPAVIMLCGLQGSGKTTHCAKLAKYLHGKDFKKKVLVAACDLQRPAAVEQLKVLGQEIDCPVFAEEGAKDPVSTAKKALKKAKDEDYDVLIVDTAGRLHIDDDLMGELEKIKDAINPHEVLFVINATTGQDAVKTAAEFDSRVAITGSILTMLDSQARGGAAISIKEVTGKPLKFEGVGEKLNDFQLFNPTSMADRILGMGDTINFVRKAEEVMSKEESKKMEEKLKKATFTYEDYLKQMQSFKKMGSLSKILGMIPGAAQMLKQVDMPEKELTKIEAIILSMTLQERRGRCDLVTSRRKRIAKGSGTKPEDVNKLIKSFRNAKKMFKGMPNMKQLQKMMGGAPWR